MSLFPHEASEVFQKINRKQPDGSVRIDPHNFYTSPPKKGGYTPGVYFGPFPEYMPDPYDRKERFKKEKNSKFKGVIHDAAFRTTDHGGENFNKDMDLYKRVDVQKPAPKRSTSQKIAKHDLPFRSSDQGGRDIGKYPEYIPNPINIVKRKAPSAQEPWRASTQKRTCPSPSITGNIHNIRSEYPNVKRLN